MISPYLLYSQSSIMTTASITKHETDLWVSKPLISKKKTKKNPWYADHPSPNRNKLNKIKNLQIFASE